jgi:hypothetical protein
VARHVVIQAGPGPVPESSRRRPGPSSSEFPEEILHCESYFLGTEWLSCSSILGLALSLSLPFEIVEANASKIGGEALNESYRMHRLKFT